MSAVKDAVHVFLKGLVEAMGGMLVVAALQLSLPLEGSWVTWD